MSPDRDRLLATVVISSRARKMIALDSHGSLMNVFRDSKLLPDTTDICRRRIPMRMIVADNGADVVVH